MNIRTLVNGVLLGAACWLLLFVIGAIAFAGTKPIAQPADKPIVFDTMDAAVLHAVTLIPNKASHEFEYGGSILFCDKFNGYVFTMPVTNRSLNWLDFETAARPSWKCSIKARYHTHPRVNEYAELFSSGDIYTARGENIPVYLHLQWVDRTKVFIPGVTPTQQIVVSGHLTVVSSGQEL